MNKTHRQVACGRTNGVRRERLPKGTVLWLVAVLLIGLGLRLTYLLMVTSNPEFRWIDPDSYMREARNLAGHGEGWRWSFDAVKHSVGGRDYALPPLYQVFLSLFALFPSFPFTAQVGQVLLATFAIAMIFELGRQIHSARAGLVAAAVYALWLPNIIAVWSTMQEALYIPLVLLAFVLFTRAMSSDSGYLSFGFAGVVFGLAALTRSMPVYFMLPAGLLYVATATDRKRAWRRAVALLIGFALVTVPYSVVLSLHLGEATFIENHGGLRIVDRYGGTAGQEPAGAVEVVSALWRAFVTSPGEVLATFEGTARSLFYVNGGRLLQIYFAAETYAGAVFWKIVVHLGVDLLFIVSLVLAPFGLVAAIRWRVSALFALWIVINISLTVLSGFGGARLRAPIEPHMIVLASVMLTGRYQRRSIGGWLLSGAIALVLALTVFPQVPRSLKARADYGVKWSSLSRPKTTSMRGQAGFNLIPLRGVLSFDVRFSQPVAPQAAADIKVYLNGELVDEAPLGGVKRRFKYEWARLQLVFVELTATNRKTGKPSELIVRLGR